MLSCSSSKCLWLSGGLKRQLSILIPCSGIVTLDIVLRLPVVEQLLWDRTSYLLGF